MAVTRKCDRRTDRRTDRQTDRRTDRQTDRQTDRHETDFVREALKRKMQVEILILEQKFFLHFESENKASAALQTRKQK